jgi:hypothetical protein
MINEYKMRDIPKLLNIEKSTVALRANDGTIVPDIKPKGQGTDRIFSRRNLIEYKMADTMIIELGCSRLICTVALSILRHGSFTYPLPPRHDIVFDDFYTNNSWGMEKDLLFFVNNLKELRSNKGPIGTTYLWLEKVPIDKSGSICIGEDILERTGLSRNPFVAYIRLGLIKRFADDYLLNKGI